jgi:predicted MPP superfamily phosphohydrolase
MSLDGLLAELRKLERAWKPTIICLTGDIAWRGAESDYAEAKNWLDELLAACGLTYDQLVVSAGNHDVIRAKAEKLPRPESTENADKVLSPPIAEHFEGPFAEFIAFCKKAGLPALKFGDFEFTAIP